MLGKSIIVAALFLVAFVSVTDAQAAGVFGLDISSGISQTISQSGWSCLRTQGNYTFAIIEVRLCLSIIHCYLVVCVILFPLCLIFLLKGWQGGYGQNTFLSTAVARAWAGGMQHVDVYAFMCPRCSGNGVSGVQSLVNYLRTNGVRFGMIWMDIEQCSGCWNADLGSNCAWVQSLAQTYVNLGIHLGIYSSPYEVRVAPNRH